MHLRKFGKEYINYAIMETNNNGIENRNDFNANEHKHNDSHDVTKIKELGIDHDVSGNNIVEKGIERRRYNQQYGNRKYKSYTNHSSANDQPRNDSGA